MSKFYDIQLFDKHVIHVEPNIHIYVIYCKSKNKVGIRYSQFRKSIKIAKLTSPAI